MNALVRGLPFEAAPRHDTVTRPGADTNAFPAGLRFVEVPDDRLEPTLRRRDYLLIEPVSHFAGEGIYLLRNALGLTSNRADAAIGRGYPQIRIWADNLHYPTRYVTPEEFAAIVVGKAAMLCRVMDSRFHHIHPVAA